MLITTADMPNNVIHDVTCAVCINTDIREREGERTCATHIVGDEVHTHNIMYE